MYDVFLYTNTTPAGQPGYILEYDSRSSEAPPLLPMLKQHVLRSKVKVRDVSDEYDVWTAWGSESTPEISKTWSWARSGAVEPVWEGSEWPWGTQNESLIDRRAVGLGKRLLTRKGDKRECFGYVWVDALADVSQHRRPFLMMLGVQAIIFCTGSHSESQKVFRILSPCRPFRWNLILMSWVDVCVSFFFSLLVHHY